MTDAKVSKARSLLSFAALPCLLSIGAWAINADVRLRAAENRIHVLQNRSHTHRSAEALWTCSHGSFDFTEAWACKVCLVDAGLVDPAKAPRSLTDQIHGELKPLGEYQSFYDAYEGHNKKGKVR